MNLRDLDEAQGLTAEMVQVWAEAKGWKYQSCRLQAPSGFQVFFRPRKPETLPWMIMHIAKHCGRTPQSLLRAINPRMRKGLPSQAANQGHNAGDGLWLYQEPGKDPGTCAISEDGTRIWTGVNGAIFGSACGDFLFWPCDGALNKVRWPEKDGVML